MNDTAFPFVPLPAGRRASKPRAKGLTMVMDWGMPLAAQEDWLGLNAPFVDLAKLVVGTARLYGESYLRKKLELYRRHEVTPFLGGQFLENLIHEQGLAAIGPYCEEALRLGIAAIEVSDNVVTLTREERTTLIRAAVDRGLVVHGEVGSKYAASDAATLISQARDCFEAGADIVLVEAAELVRDDKPDTGLCDQLRAALDIDKLMFELGGPWIPETPQWSVFALRLMLVRTFGADVNLANVMPEQVLDTEALRCGLSDPLRTPEELEAGSALRSRDGSC